MTCPIFFNPNQSVPGLDSFSPSAGKPARFVELMQHYQFHNYGPQRIGPVTPVTPDDLLRVHSAQYVQGVFDGTTNNGFENRDPRVPVSCLWTIGSMLAAARWALKNPLSPACSPSSGFHHAGTSWGGGYCTFNGLMVVAAKLIGENPSINIGILDCDMHYGDGTADILRTHPQLDERILHRTSGKHFYGDDPQEEALEFHVWLHHSIEELNDFGCDVVLYQAGADMHIQDPLGGFLDDAGMALRDRTVFAGLEAGIAWNLAGGYRTSTDIFSDPVLATHYTTLKAAQGRESARAAKLKGIAA